MRRCRHKRAGRILGRRSVAQLSRRARDGKSFLVDKKVLLSPAPACILFVKKPQGTVNITFIYL